MSTPHILVCGPNWIGDGVMAMPALQRYREEEPDCSLTMLVKPALGPLWAMHPDVDEVLLLPPGVKGIWQVAGRLREQEWQAAYVLPNSVRAALPPRLGAIPKRIGFDRSQGRLLLSEGIVPRGGADRAHQAYEYLDLFLPGYNETALPRPKLDVPEAERQEAGHRLPSEDVRWVGLMPGASRGPSKRWPAEHFRALAAQLLRDDGIRVVLMGGPAERELCEAISSGQENGMLNFAGRTSLPMWAALLQRCALVVCNDSGGMHLAAAVGTPLVAIFGQTDPAVTGPLGAAEILQRSEARSRDIARDSEAARKSLASIPPQEVYDTVRRLLDG